MMVHCLALMLAAVVSAGTPAPVINPLHTFSPEMSHAIDDLGAREVSDHRTPGVAIGIIEDGRLVYARGFGYANVARHLPFEPSTQFYVGAISKQFTAAAILLLEQDGKLKLDDPVIKYVPELTIAKNVTIEQLLHQTSGLPDYQKAPGINPDETRSVKRSDLIAAVDKMTPLAEPGTTYRYNNFNYIVAALVVERVGGVDFSDYLQQHIFLPLVMNQTFYAGDTGISNHAVGYTGTPGRFVPAKMTDPTWLLGTGGVVSNIYDLAKWDIEMPILLRDDAVRDMFSAGSTPNDQQYGLGWFIDQRDGRRFIWHGGEIAGFHAMNALLPDDHVAVIVFANVDSVQSGAVAQPEAIASRVLDIVVPPSATHMDNAVVVRAREWLLRLAEKRIDRTQLTKTFSQYLTDSLVENADVAHEGKLLTLVPVSSTTLEKGDTRYTFLVRYSRGGSYRFLFTVTKDGKIDGLFLER